MSGTAALALSVFLVDCIDTRSSDRLPPEVVPDAGNAIPVSVTVDLASERAVVAPYHFGIHASVYDNALHNPMLPDLIVEAGIALLRWPGGGYSDNYHWSNHTLTPFLDDEEDEDREPEPGYLANDSDFGNFVRLVDRVGTAVMITVNYGSNLQHDGPGEPKEAAAWVAYANGDPLDEREIGVDGSGNDWRTVGYWASLRASEPEAEDDGLNFLRIGRADPLGVEYWEIGNEVFGNGFHESNGNPGFELDLHVPYPNHLDPDAGDKADDPMFDRFRREELSGKTYGAGVRAYAEEMKAVDPTIKIGAVLGTPPDDESWMDNADDPRTAVVEFHWNRDVVTECGEYIDFGIVHWYPNPPPVNSSDPDEIAIAQLAAVLTYPRLKMPTMVTRLRETFAEHAGSNADNIEIVMTEVGTGVPVPQGRGPTGLNRGQAMGIFAADMYLTAAELGFVNVDWLELHNGTFLSERSPAKGPAFSGIQMARSLVAPGDRLVAVESDVPSLVAHASVRDDGRVGVLLINTQAPELFSARITVTFEGGGVGARGERYDYWVPEPDPSDAGVPDAAPDAMADAGPPRPSGASGTIVGPTPFSGMTAPFTIELPPYAVTLLLFDAEE